jgi:hypothetical protein
MNRGGRRADSLWPGPSARTAHTVRPMGAYRTMIDLVLFAVIAAVVDWSVFRWA